MIWLKIATDVNGEQIGTDVPLTKSDSYIPFKLNGKNRSLLEIISSSA